MENLTKKDPRLFVTSNHLVAQAFRNPLLFTAWKSRKSDAEEHYTHWTRGAFRNRILGWRSFVNWNSYPAGEWLTAVDYIRVDSRGVATNDIRPSLGNSLEFVSGFRIGIYMILAERLSGEAMSYSPVLGTPNDAVISLQLGHRSGIWTNA